MFWSRTTIDSRRTLRKRRNIKYILSSQIWRNETFVIGLQIQTMDIFKKQDSYFHSRHGYF